MVSDCRTQSGMGAPTSRPAKEKRFWNCESNTKKQGRLAKSWVAGSYSRSRGTIDWK